MRRAVSLGALALLACSAAAAEGPLPPDPPREFRAAWVATVANIDWPSKPGLTTDEQKAEAVRILDRCRALHLNAVIFQVRPHADALYVSELEPWSFYLTGREGQAPEPLYDPLAFWVEAAHARGLELHAWFNPYRASHPAHKGEPSERSLVRSRPELVVKLGDKGYAWMDPALRAVQDHSFAVVMDVVRRYEVDGVHFDDYFYPYPSYNDDKDFPDDASFAAYQKSGGRLSRADWRRAAVNTFIERVARGIRKERSQVRFGISPFGIWRPGNPASITGFDQFGQLYADARLWLQEGWLDYLTPQLYWPTARLQQSFPILLQWWLAENRRGRHVWPGLSLGRATADCDAVEVVNQIMITRGMAPRDTGQVMFSMKGLERDALAAKLVPGPYDAQALVPRSPWLDKKPPSAPRLTAAVRDGRIEASWQSQGKEPAFLFVVYTLAGGRWRHEIVPAGTSTWSAEAGTPPVSALAVSAVDRRGNESARAAWTATPR
jgi:uncharacterized lipoprotein YddW (UPF0748 family)